MSAFEHRHSLPCCSLSNAFEAATRTYRHLANGIESDEATDKQTDRRIAAMLNIPTPYSVVERRLLAGELSLSHARLAADG